MRRGFLYLVAIMDWASRKVLAWRLSNTMDAGFCVAALEEALVRFGKPEIFNTDQGSQFTSQAFTSVLREAEDRGRQPSAVAAWDFCCAACISHPIYSFTSLVTFLPHAPVKLTSDFTCEAAATSLRR